MSAKPSNQTFLKFEMRKAISVIAVMVLLASAVPLAVIPAAASTTGSSGGYEDLFEGDNELTKDELVDAILSHTLEESGALPIDELRDAAHVYVYWGGEPKTITDSADRTVVIYKPIKRIIVLSSDIARALRIFGDEDKVIGICDTIKKYPFYFPEMSQKTVVGSWQDVDWDKIVSLEPDLVITYATGSVNADLAEEKLEPFGITVVGLYLYVSDEYDQIFRELEKLAILLEKEEEAEQYILWHDEYESRVQDFIESKEKPKVFLTYTAGAIGTTTEIKGYGPGSIDYILCEKAGGKSITDNLTNPTKYSPVSAEWVLTEDPDIIILKCGNVFGWWDSESEPADLIDQTLYGKEWDTINATVNNKIYAVPWSITNGFEHIYGVVLLAKIFYPEFEIDPTEVYKEFLEDFLRVEYPEGEGKVLVYPPLAT